jgi:capsular exopolysaccharide synthesis family protein
MFAICHNVKYELNVAAEEAYKNLRANIKFCAIDSDIRTLAFTSYSPGEGKSTTSINLSISIAKTGTKVLYIDADTRKPMPLKNLVKSNLKGLTDYLKGTAGIQEIINKTDIDGLSFISSGIKSNNPGELIASDRFGILLKEAKELYDMIIIDTPPMGSVIDCAIIAAQSDGTIIVIESNAVKHKNALMMKEQLQKAKANILGVVLNKVAKTDYKNYYGSYNYYGSNKNLRDIESQRFLPDFLSGNGTNNKLRDIKSQRLLLNFLSGNGTNNKPVKKRFFNKLISKRRYKDV